MLNYDTKINSKLKVLAKKSSEKKRFREQVTVV